MNKINHEKYALIGIIILVLVLAGGYYFSDDEGSRDKYGKRVGVDNIVDDTLRGVRNVAGENDYYSTAGNSKIDVYPEVWSSNGPDGKTYEFKVNCGPDYSKLEECFLWDLTKIIVINPLGDEFELKKDFNINNYSGEITRRWVLYGPSQGGLPIQGKHKFNYYKDENLVLEQKVDYNLEIIDYPKNISWKREGSDIYVEWIAPNEVKEGMWYKVLIFHNERQVISQKFEWNANNAKLPNIPLKNGEEARLNVAVYFREGYAYSEYYDFVW